MGKSSPNLAYWTILQTGRVTPLAVGKPGMAKSKSAEAFARATGRQIYTLIGSLREPSDIGGYCDTPVRSLPRGTLCCCSRCC